MGIYFGKSALRPFRTGGFAICAMVWYNAYVKSRIFMMAIDKVGFGGVQMFDAGRRTSTTRKHMSKQDDPLPSGLSGPVMLRFGEFAE